MRVAFLEAIWAEFEKTCVGWVPSASFSDLLLPFPRASSDMFGAAKSSLQGDALLATLQSAQSVVLSQLLHAADRCTVGLLTAASPKTTPPLASGFEIAAVDAWAQCFTASTCRFLGFTPSPPPGSSNWASFYTAALNYDLAEVISSAEFGSKYTPHLKVKVNDDVDYCVKMMAALQGRFAAGERM